MMNKLDFNSLQVEAQQCYASTRICTSLRVKTAISYLVALLGEPPDATGIC